MASMYQIHLAEILYRLISDQNSAPIVHFDEIKWSVFFDCLETKELIPKKVEFNKENLSSYLPNIRMGKIKNGGIEFKWRLQEKAEDDCFNCPQNSELQILINLFGRNINKEICLSFCIFCFRKLLGVGKLPSPYILICNKQIDVTSDIEVIKDALFFDEDISIVINTNGNTDYPPTCKKWLLEENGWNISADPRTIRHLVNTFDDGEIDQQTKNIRKIFFTKITRWIFEEIEKNPYGSYLISKIKSNPKHPDPQIINFLKAMVKIKILYNLNSQTRLNQSYKNFDVVIETNESHVRSAIRPVQNKLRLLGNQDEKYSQEDYIRVLFAISRSCKASPDHTTSRLSVKTNLRKFFGGDYSEKDCMIIVNRMSQIGILEVLPKQNIFPKSENADVKCYNQPSSFRFKNKLFRLYIEGYGSSRYANESIMDFIRSPNPNSSRLDHLTKYEDLTFFSAAYFEAAKDRDSVIQTLMAEVNDFSISNRATQAAAIHILSMFLVEYDHLLTGKLRKEAFVSVFGKNCYPHQKEFFDCLIKREFYRKQYDTIKNAVMKVDKDGYANSDPLFFFYDVTKELCGDSCRNDYTKAIALHSLAWRISTATEKLPFVICEKLSDYFAKEEITKITESTNNLECLMLRHVYLYTEKAQEKLASSIRKLYAVILHEIVKFPITALQWLGNLSEGSAVIERIHTAEYLLYAFSDIGRVCKLPQDEKKLTSVATLAIATDIAKKRISKVYNSVEWDGTNMYMTCASARVFSVFESQKIRLNSKIKLSNQEINRYLFWLQRELQLGYEARSLRYALFMIRLLSYTDIDMAVVRNLILYLNRIDNLNEDTYNSLLDSQNRNDTITEDQNKEQIRQVLSEKEKFKACFLNTNFLEYDNFPKSLDDICVKYGLVFKISNELVNIKADNKDTRIPFTHNDFSLWYTKSEHHAFPVVKNIEIQNATILNKERWSDNDTQSRNLIISDVVDDVRIKMSAAEKHAPEDDFTY